MVTLLASPAAAPEPRVPVGPMLSIYDSVYIGIDQFGHPKYVPAMYRNVIMAGAPGTGKSTQLSNFVSHAGLSMDCRLVLLDGKQVELGLWKDCADVFVGPDIEHAIATLERLQTMMDRRYTYLLSQRRRKIQRGDGLLAIMCAIDEIAFYSTVAGDKKLQDRFANLLRDLVARGRAVGLIVVAATQRPSSDIIPTSLRICSRGGTPDGAPPTRHQTSSLATAGLPAASLRTASTHSTPAPVCLSQKTACPNW